MAMQEQTTLTASMVRHLDALVKASGSVNTASEAIRKDLENLSEKQVDAFNAAARQHIRDTVKDDAKRDRALGLLAKVVTMFRKSKGWAGKRAKGAGRKSKDAATSEASALDQYTAAANYLMIHWMDVTDEQRKTALGPIMRRIAEWQAVNYKSKAA